MECEDFYAKYYRNEIIYLQTSIFWYERNASKIAGANLNIIF